MPFFFQKNIYDFEPLVVKMSSIILFFLFVSIALLILIEMGWIDYTAWKIENMNFLPSVSPIWVKDSCCNLDFFNPYYLIYVTEQGDKYPGLFASESTRNMLFFTEPAMVAITAGSMMLLRGSIYNKKIISILSLSVLYLISEPKTLVVALLLSVFLIIILKPKTKIINVALVILFSILTYYFFIPLLLELGNTYDQIEILKNKNFGLSSLSFFPLSSADLNNRSSYGILTTLPRYGILVSLMGYFIQLYIFYFVVRLYQRKLISNYDFFTFSYIFFSFLKIPMIFNPILYIVFFYFFKKTFNYNYNKV